MKLDRQGALELLQANQGFTDPESWVGYAIQHNFKRVEAESVPTCPDCGGHPATGTVGQYIHYSSLVRLLRCQSCSLIWADARIDPAVILSHFEVAYKGNSYFEFQRGSIFRHLQDRIDQAAPKGGRVLDIGGAEGHLLAGLKKRRPDLHCTLYDISERATAYAREHFDLPAMSGPISVLRDPALRFDVVVASDVLYYEPDLAGFWEVVSSLLQEGGTLLVRVPNKLHFILAVQALRRSGMGAARLAMDDRIPFFNTEHIYILNQRYLRDRLARLGFGVSVLASPPLRQRSPLQQISGSGLFHLARLMGGLTGGRVMLSPSMVIEAKRLSGPLVPGSNPR